MTYPDEPTRLTSLGFFTEDTKEAGAARQKLAAIAMQWFNKCQSDRQGQERQWYLNLSFYTGNQHAQFRQSANGAFDLYVPKAPPWRARIVINQVRRVVRKEVSRLTAQKPNAFVVPASNEDADVFAAQAGEQIWDALWRRLHVNKVIREAVFWQTVCGTGYIKTYWDATKIDPEAQTILETVTGLDENAQITGDICIENISPFHILVPDLMLTELEDQPYVIHAKERNNSWIRQNLGVDVNDTKLDSVDEGLRNVLKLNNSGNKKEQSIILEVWVKPGYLPELPNGGVFTVAGSQVVQGFDQWPYEHGQYPFAKLDGIQTGKFYAASVVEDLIPIQRELNRSRAQLIESKNKMSKPQLAAEKGSVDARKITSEPGIVVEYAVGFQAPQPIPLQNLPSYVTQEIDRLYSDIQDLSGQHEVSNGSTPPGVTAATAISFLQEQDESLTASHYTSIEEATEKIGSQSLTYVKMYWDEKRTVKVVGLEGAFDVQAFKGADLRGNSDLRVEGGSALPTSRAAKQAFIMDLMKMGFIPPDQGLEIMEVGALNKIYERIQVDKRQAQRENLKMARVTEEDIQAHNKEYMDSHPEIQKDPDMGLKLDPPLIISVNTYDNHQIHIEEHNNYRKSQAFDRATPMSKALFEEHVKMHQEAMAGIMMHPLTGMDPSNPNAPDPEEEQDQADMMAQENSAPQGENSGPVPMPDMSSEEVPQ